MNTATKTAPRITRLDFFEGNFTTTDCFAQARAYRRAWKLAVMHRAPHALRRYYREIMRERALETVQCVRAAVARRHRIDQALASAA